MTLPLTLALMALCAGLIALAAWRSGRPSDPLHVRFIPWRPIMVITGGVFMLLLAHLFTYFGLEPGQGIPRL